ncbi:MAG: cytidylate kinase-like family protein [Ruminococcaceae bacterium]|nr:cytidylate kinase-like family protein [Oscillospiraceae bacterium]
MPMLTISRQLGSFGDEIADELSRKLGWEVITRDIIIQQFLPDLSSHEQHMLKESARFYLSKNEAGETYLNQLIQALNEFNEEHSAILVGFGSQVIFADNPDALHVRIVAPQKVRLARIKRQYRVDDTAALSVLSTSDRKHKRFVQTVFGVDLTDAANYHLTLNTAALSLDECVAAIQAMLRERVLRRTIERETEEQEAINNLSDRPELKNPTEREFARILDMYHIEWVYEPKTFPIEWDAEGNVTLAFSPDFYLTKFDTYIELTTMNQKYVTEKNRKAKKVRELYPGTNIRIVYKKDFQSLAERFNRGS